jgi:hypothetical protein
VDQVESEAIGAMTINKLIVFASTENLFLVYPGRNSLTSFLILKPHFANFIRAENVHPASADF